MIDLISTDALPNDTEIYAEVVVDSFANVKGGIDRSSALLYYSAFGVEYAFNPSFKLHSEVWLTDNHSVSELVGDEQGVSNIEANSAGLHWGKLALEFSREHLSVLFGIYDINYEFDVLESANLFVQSAFGMGTVFGVSGPNGPGTYPAPGVTARFAYYQGNHTAKFAITDGAPGSPGLSYRQPSEQPDKTNLLLTGEYQYQDTSTRLLLGWWGYTDDSTYLNSVQSTGQRNDGWYLRGEHTFNDITLFGRVGAGASSFNFFDEFYSVGVTGNAGLIGRADDSWGMAWAHAKVSENAEQPLASGESVIEVTYSVAVNDYLSIQPNIQWIGSPGASLTTDDAVLLGLRFIVSFEE